MTTSNDREKALDALRNQVSKKYGKNSLEKLGSMEAMEVETFSTGSLAIDIATGVGGIPRGRIVEIYGPESSGKCLTADALISTPQGLLTVEELFSQFGLELTEEENVTDVSDKGIKVFTETGDAETIAAATHNGIRAVKRVTLDDGRSITVTDNHPLRVRNENNEPVWVEAKDLTVGTTVVSLLEDRLAAGEDTMDHQQAFHLGELYAYHNAADRTEFRSVTAMNSSIGVILSENADNAKLISEIDEISDALRKQEYADITVPQVVRYGNKGVRFAFLSGLFDDILWDQRTNATITAPSQSFLQEVQVLLLGQGFQSRLVDKGDVWTLSVSERKVADRRTLVYNEIVSIEDAGEQPTFDIMVPEKHNFVANGIINHNTTLTLHAIASAQAQGGTAAFIDAEHALDPEYARNLGVNVDELLFSQPDNGDHALQMVEMIVNSNAVDLVVVDSVAALVPEAELKGEIGDSHVGLQARMMSQAMRKLAGAISRSKSTVIFINQLREKVGVFFGSPETTSGGKALKFYASMRLDVRRTGSTKDNKGNMISNTTKVKVVKNKVAPPMKTAETEIFYGTGFSRESDILKLGVDRGIIRKSGSWYSYEGKQVGQGEVASKTTLEENPALRDEIEGKILVVLEEEREEARKKNQRRWANNTPQDIEDVEDEEQSDE